MFRLLSIGFEKAYGDLSHNKYMYGVGAKSGEAHSAYSVGILIPTFSLGFMTIINYSKSFIDQSENYKADLVRGEKNQDSINLFIRIPLIK
jgi:hypothetical protein